MLKKFKFYSIVIAAAVALLSGCKTTSSLQRNFERAKPYEENFITGMHDVSVDGAPDYPCKYIFVRLHHINYNQGSRILYVWRAMASYIGKGTDDNIYTHSSINCTLTDDFVGITTKGKNQVKLEQFSNPDDNPYFRRINMNKTSCTVIAIPVSQSDWENCRRLLDYSLNPKEDLKFSKPISLAIPRKTKATKKKIHSYDFKSPDQYEAVVLDSDISVYFKNEHEYACSTFIMKILSTATGIYSTFLKEENLSPQDFAPVDLMLLKDAQVLFMCRASCFDRAAAEFARQNPSFMEYIR